MWRWIVLICQLPFIDCYESTKCKLKGIFFGVALSGAVPEDCTLHRYHCENLKFNKWYEYKKKGNVFLVTGCGCPWGCETSRLPHFLDNRPTDGGEVVSLTRRPPFTSRKIPATHFCYRLS
jgi:hypothetical protein